MTITHTLLQPEGWVAPKGYSNGVAARGTMVFTGGQIGSHLAMRFGSKLIKPLLIIMSLALTTKMLLDPKNPIHIYLFG